MISFVKCDVPGGFKGKIRQILNTKLQYGVPKVWLMIDDSLENENQVEFFKVATDWKLEGDDAQIMQDALYVGSVKDDEKVLWHVYCLASKPGENVESPEENGDSPAEEVVES